MLYLSTLASLCRDQEGFSLIHMQHFVIGQVHYGVIVFLEI